MSFRDWAYAPGTRPDILELIDELGEAAFFRLVATVKNGWTPAGPTDVLKFAVLDHYLLRFERSSRDPGLLILTKVWRRPR